MVSREFLTTQSVITAAHALFPLWMAEDGGQAEFLGLVSAFADREDYWFFREVRKHFTVLDRREREAADVVRLDTWREAAGLK